MSLMNAWHSIRRFRRTLERLVERAAGILAAGLMLSSTVHAAEPPAAASLATAEFAFAARSVATDMKQAFLSVLADDGILFRPGPVNGREVMEKNPAPAIELNWRPAFVHVSADGELGLSTGPARILFKADPQRAPHYTHFLSIWEKRAGVWKLRVDVGIDHEEPFLADAWLELSQGSGKGPGLAVLKAAEQRFNDRARESGYVAALAELGDANIRVYRTPLKPMIGQPALAAQKAAPQFLQKGAVGEVLQQGIAGSGDLGWSIVRLAAAEGPAPTVAHALRVWRAVGNEFRVIADLQYDLPKK